MGRNSADGIQKTFTCKDPFSGNVKVVIDAMHKTSKGDFLYWEGSGAYLSPLTGEWVKVEKGQHACVELISVPHPEHPEVMVKIKIDYTPSLRLADETAEVVKPVEKKK